MDGIEVAGEWFSVHPDEWADYDVTADAPLTTVFRDVDLGHEPPF